MTRSVREEHVMSVIRQQMEILEPCTVRLLGREWVVEPHVHNPTLDGSSRVLAEFVVKHEPERLVDVGTGSGVVGITAAMNSFCQVIGTDINPVAIVNANENAVRHGADKYYRAIKMDLLTPSLCAWADTVVWNSPFLSYNQEVRHTIERNLIDPNYDLHRRFFEIIGSAKVNAFLVVSRWADERRLRVVAAEVGVRLVDTSNVSRDYAVLSIKS